MGPVYSSDVTDPLFRRLVAAGLLAEADRALWALLSPARREGFLRALARRTRHLTVLLEAVDQGHNQAAILRSAEAFGLTEVHVVPGKHPFRPSRRVTQGAHKWLQVCFHPDLEAAATALRAAGYRLWATWLDPAAVPLEEVPLEEPVAFLFGNELEGVSGAARSLADGLFRIPTVGFVQSLNVSVAAAITLHHAAARARRRLGPAYGLPPAARREVLRRWLRDHSARARALAAQLTRPRGGSAS